MKSNYGIEPKIKHAFHELEVFVDGQSMYRYTTAERIPSVEAILEAMGLGSAG